VRLSLAAATSGHRKRTPAGSAFIPTIVLNGRKRLRSAFTSGDTGRVEARIISRFKRLRAAPGLLTRGAERFNRPAAGTRMSAFEDGRTSGGRRDCRSRLSYSNIGGAKRKTRTQPGCLPPLLFVEVNHA